MGIYIKDLFFDAYIACALWSTCDNNTVFLDENYDISDFVEDALEKLRLEALQFLNENIKLINKIPDNYTYEDLGHDFWLTRNGHGTGFWDRGFPKELGDKLTKACEKYPEIHIYVGDDWKLHV